MLPCQTKLFVDPLVSWATREQLVSELWIVGSRARGDHRPDSDLDVVLMSTMPRSAAFNFFFWGKHHDFAGQLSRRLGVTVHLLQGDPELQTEEVASALAADGICIFSRLKDDL